MLHKPKQNDGFVKDPRESQTYLVVSIAIAVQALLLAWGAYAHSPTLNEPGHLVAGISNWQFGRFDVYRVNPPLVHMVAAVPALASGAEIDWHRYYDSPGNKIEFALGEDFIVANGVRSFWLFTLARWACIPFSLLGGYICFRWARFLYGTWAGLLALALWCFCPNILAHGILITPDIAATSMGLTACYSFWHWLRRPSWRHAVISGLILGLAELTKMTLVVFFPLWILMWLIYRWPDRKSLYCRDWGKELAMLTLQMTLALYVINLGYGFEGSFKRLGDYHFFSTLFSAEAKNKQSTAGDNRFADTWLACLPVPLPMNYVMGMDLQRRDFENYYSPSYLRGEFQNKGWWYYYIYALTIKVPLGTWILIGMAMTRGLWKSKPRAWMKDERATDSDLVAPPPDSPIEKIRGESVASPLVRRHPPTSRRDEFVVLCPAVVVIAFVSSQTGFSEHMRYVLPAFPFVFVWIGRIAQYQTQKQWLSTGIAVAALIWSICSSLLVYPHSLSYFNEFAGGPTGGPKHLIHSNVDWGQDLLYLKKWLDQHPESRPLNLFYFGSFDPKYAGVDYVVQKQFLSREDGGPIPLEKIPPGWYAISVNFVRGLPDFVYRTDGTKGDLRQNAMTAFQKLKPVAMAGYSIYIYHIVEHQ